MLLWTMLTAGGALAGPSEVAVGLVGGVNRFDDSQGPYDAGPTVMLTFERAKWFGERTYWSYRIGYGWARTNFEGFISFPDLPYGTLDLNLGRGDPEGGVWGALGLGADVLIFVPLPVAATARVGYRFPNEDGPRPIVGAFARGLAAPFLDEGRFPAASRWVLGGEVAIGF